MIAKIIVRETALTEPLWRAQIYSLVPSPPHLQSLIACRMQIWRGEVWEIWSHAVMSGRNVGRALTKDLKALSYNVCPRVGAQSVCIHVKLAYQDIIIDYIPFLSVCKVPVF